MLCRGKNLELCSQELETELTNSAVNKTSKQDQRNNDNKALKIYTPRNREMLKYVQRKQDEEYKNIWRTYKEKLRKLALFSLRTEGWVETSLLST